MNKAMACWGWVLLVLLGSWAGQLRAQQPVDSTADEGADSQRWDAPYGSAYSTALVVMTLGAPNQLMPMCQR